MDINQLCHVLQACMSSNPAERKAAEDALKQCESTPGHISNLLRVALESSLDTSLRQVAAISFKNLVKRNWDDPERPNIINDDDKKTVRDNLLEGIIRCPPIIRSQLLETARSIIYSDFPVQWPQLMESVVQNLNTQEEARVYGALSVLRIIARKFEFKDEDERQPLQQVVNMTFPILINIFQGLLHLPPTPEVSDLLKLICKTFWSATYMAIPDLLVHPDQFVAWMTCIHALLIKPVPQEGQPTDLGDRQRWCWWKTKKWVLHITYRIFNRYSDPKLCKGGTDQVFCKMWMEQCCLQFLEAHMQIMGLLAQGHYLSPRVTNLVLQYLTHALSLSKTYKVLKPHCSSLLTGVVFQLMCFNQQDEQLWEEDPQEYIRKGYDIIEDMYSAKTAAMNFVHELCTSRGKGNLDIVMHHVVSVVNTFHQAGPSVTKELARQMDGALLTIGALPDVLKRKEAYKQQLQTMLGQYVMPLFNSPFGHLRAKACWVAGIYADSEFAEGKGQGPVFGGLLQHCIDRLRDPELPVRVDAVVAIRGFVEPFEAEEIAHLKPLIPQLLDEFLKLMSEVENEDLVLTLETIVEKFGEDMAPYAVHLCTHLSAAFWKTQASAADDEDDDDMAALAAYGCLRAIGTLLESVSTLPHLFPQLEEILFPIMTKMLTTEGQDMFEEVVQMISYFTYFSPEISPRMWTLWPALHDAVSEWAIDYFEQVLVPLDNFISRATDVFINTKNPDYLASANKIVERALTDTNLHEADVEAAPQLLGIIMQNCRGRVDACIGPYISLAINRLHSAEGAYFKDLLVNVVANALYYNPVLALQHLQQSGQLGTLFSTWFQMIFAQTRAGKPKHFKRKYDKKVCILGMSALMSVPEECVPPEVQGGWGQLMTATMKLLGALKQQQEEDEDGGEEEEGEEEEEEEEAELEDDEDEEVDEGYLKRLSKAARKNAGAEEEEESDDDWTEEEEAQMPIDPVNPFITFADTMQQVQTHYPHRFQALTGTVEPAVQASLQGMMEYIAQQKTKLIAA